jgi:DNA-binding winged helix-turn-helix (wHTH) protein
LLAEVWGRQYKGETQYLRVFINRLRAKIEDDPAHPRYIATERGPGIACSWSSSSSGRPAEVVFCGPPLMYTSVGSP